MYCVSQFCRVCVSNDGTLVDVHSVDTDFTTFYHKLTYIHANLMREDTNMLTFICKTCREKLKKSYEFLKLCLNSEDILRNYIIQLEEANMLSKTDPSQLSDLLDKNHVDLNLKISQTNATKTNDSSSHDTSIRIRKNLLITNSSTDFNGQSRKKQELTISKLRKNIETCSSSTNCTRISVAIQDPTNNLISSSSSTGFAGQSGSIRESTNNLPTTSSRTNFPRQSDTIQEPNLNIVHTELGIEMIKLEPMFDAADEPMTVQRRSLDEEDVREEIGTDIFANITNPGHVQPETSYASLNYSKAQRSAPCVKREKLQRISMTLAQKIEILDKIRGGTRCSVLGRMYGVNDSTIRTIRNNESSIRACVSTSAADNMRRMTTRNVHLNRMETLLNAWIEDMLVKEAKLTGALVRERALQLYDLVCKEDDKLVPVPFVASKGWLYMFKKRFNWDFRVDKECFPIDGFTTSSIH